MSRGHDLKIGQVTAFYTFAFDFGTKYSVGEAAQRLLDAGIAETMAIPALNDVHLAPRYKRLLSTRSGAEVLIAIDDWFKRRTKLRELTWRARAVLFAILFRSILASIGRKRSKGDDDNDKYDARAKMQEVIEEINVSVQKSRLYVGLQAAMDRRLHEVGYLDRVPFVRLELRQFTYSNRKKIVKFGDESFEDSDSPCLTLLLHRSGVALITVGMRMAQHGQGSTLEIFRRPSNLKFSYSLIAEPVLRHAGRKSKLDENEMPGEWLAEEYEGVRWRTYDHGESKTSLTDVFRLYQDSVLEIIGAGGVLADWMAYPTVYIDSLGCCRRKRDWLKHHHEEFRRYLIGASIKEVGAERMASDYSLNEAYSVWLTGGSTVCIHWSFERPELPLAYYFRWVNISENATLRYWQLRRLDHQISEVGVKQSNFEHLMVHVVAGMREVQNPYMPVDAAGEASIAISSMLGAEATLRSIESRIAMLQNLVSMRESGRTGRRATRFAVAAVFVAMIVALPAIKDTLSIVNEFQDDGLGGAISRMIGSAGGRPENSWPVFLVLVLLILAMLIPIRLARWARLRRVIRRRLDMDPWWDNKRFRVDIVDEDSNKKEDG